MFLTAINHINDNNNDDSDEKNMFFEQQNDIDQFSELKKNLNDLENMLINDEGYAGIKLIDHLLLKRENIWKQWKNNKCKDKLINNTIVYDEGILKEIEKYMIKEEVLDNRTKINVTRKSEHEELQKMELWLSIKQNNQLLNSLETDYLWINDETIKTNLKGMLEECFKSHEVSKLVNEQKDSNLDQFVKWRLTNHFIENSLLFLYKNNLPMMRKFLETNNDCFEKNQKDLFSIFTESILKDFNLKNLSEDFSEYYLKDSKVLSRKNSKNDIKQVGNLKEEGEVNQPLKFEDIYSWNCHNKKYWELQEIIKTIATHQKLENYIKSNEKIEPVIKSSQKKTKTDDNDSHKKDKRKKSKKDKEKTEKKKSSKKYEHDRKSSPNRKNTINGEHVLMKSKSPKEPSSNKTRVLKSDKNKIKKSEQSSKNNIIKDKKHKSKKI